MSLCVLLAGVRPEPLDIRRSKEAAACPIRRVAGGTGRSGITGQITGSTGIYWAEPETPDIAAHIPHINCIDESVIVQIHCRGRRRRGEIHIAVIGMRVTPKYRAIAQINNKEPFAHAVCGRSIARIVLERSADTQVDGS